MNPQKMNIANLIKLIRGTWTNGGWLKKFNKYPNSHKFSELYHEAYITEMRDSEKYYYKKELPKVWAEIDKFIEENKDFAEEVKNRRKLELKEDFEKEKKQLEAELYTDIKIEEKEDKLKKLEKIDNKLKSKIDDEMIRKAKQYPIERIIKVEKDFALCCWHRDKKPSMYCKNNYAHCFSCGKTGSVIDVYMEVNNCDFKDAVLALNN